MLVSNRLQSSEVDTGSLPWYQNSLQLNIIQGSDRETAGRRRNGRRSENRRCETFRSWAKPFKLRGILVDLDKITFYSFYFSSEVNSGRLSWSPVHTNNKFWRENAQRLVEKDYKILRRLTHILETDQNTEVDSFSCRYHEVTRVLVPQCWMPRPRRIRYSLSKRKTSYWRDLGQANCHAINGAPGDSRVLRWVKTPFSRTKLFDITPWSPFKRWWWTTGRFWDVRSASTKTTLNFHYLLKVLVPLSCKNCYYKQSRPFLHYEYLKKAIIEHVPYLYSFNLYKRSS